MHGDGPRVCDCSERKGYPVRWRFGGPDTSLAAAAGELGVVAPSRLVANLVFRHRALRAQRGTSVGPPTSPPFGGSPPGAFPARRCGVAQQRRPSATRRRLGALSPTFTIKVAQRGRSTTSPPGHPVGTPTAEQEVKRTTGSAALTPIVLTRS